MDQYQRARFAVISFASTATMIWPLSDDTWSLKPLIAGLSPYADVPPDAASTVDLGAANTMLSDKLRQALRDYPGSLTDPSGALVASALNTKNVLTVSRQLGIPDIYRGEKQLIDGFVPKLTPPPGNSGTPASDNQIIERTELYWLFTSLAGSLILVEIYLLIRDVMRSRLVQQDVRL